MTIEVINRRDISSNSVDLYINTTCNLRCATCFLGDEYFRTKREMSVETALSIVDYLRETGVSDVAILGGEPTLHSQFSELVAQVRLACPAWEIRLVTNGNIVARRTIDSYAHVFDAVYVSLDGHDEVTNDLYRGKGSYNDATTMLAALQKRSIRSVLNVSIHRGNVGFLAEMYDLAIRCGVSRINFHWTSNVGRAADNQLALDEAEWGKVIEDFDRCQDLFGSQIASDIQQAYGSGGHEDTCKIRNKGNLQVFPDGRVHLCGLSVDNPELSEIRWASSRFEVWHKSGESQLALACGSACPMRSDEKRACCIYVRRGA